MPDNSNYEIDDDVSVASDDVDGWISISGVRCGAYTLQLVVNAGLKKLQETHGLLQKCMEICVKLNNSSILDIIHRRNLPVPILCNQTRWNSVFLMVNILRK